VFDVLEIEGHYISVPIKYVINYEITSICRKTARTLEGKLFYKNVKLERLDIK
jgi:hypothetical protein